ncbi:MAG: hypothetical protein M5U28_30910 [Sandaracinaceae bacterium]|nr:hypothetical protein [Sandaracinaceae bacterium]
MRGTVLVLASTVLACAPGPDLAQGEVVEACRRLVVCGAGVDGAHLYGRGDLFGGSARTCEAYYEVGPVRLGDPAGELACAADGVPVTLWWTALLGLDFTLERVVALGFAVGFAGFHNDRDSAAGFVWQVQTAVLFDLPAPPPADREPPLARLAAGVERRGLRW